MYVWYLQYWTLFDDLSDDFQTVSKGQVLVFSNNESCGREVKGCLSLRASRMGTLTRKAHEVCC